MKLLLIGTPGPPTAGLLKSHLEPPVTLRSGDVPVYARLLLNKQPPVGVPQSLLRRGSWIAAVFLLRGASKLEGTATASIEAPLLSLRSLRHRIAYGKRMLAIREALERAVPL